jgi:hypothetical protein
MHSGNVGKMSLSRWAQRPLGLSLLLVASSLAGCSSPAPDGEPRPREVRRSLARLLADSPEHLQLTSDLRQEGDGGYAAEAKGEGGVAYRVTAMAHERRLTYRAEGGGRVLSGVAVLPEPSFSDRHPEGMQALRAVALALHAAGVVWPALGAFGLRRRYSSRTETVLALVAALNFGFVLMWGYQLVINFGAA